jgi:hypothetical protein
VHFIAPDARAILEAVKYIIFHPHAPEMAALPRFGAARVK